MTINVKEEDLATFIATPEMMLLMECREALEAFLVTYIKEDGYDKETLENALNLISSKGGGTYWTTCLINDIKKLSQQSIIESQEMTYRKGEV